MTESKQTNWRALVVQADPDWPRDARDVVAYEFSAPPRAPVGRAADRTHENGRRVFRENRSNPYEERD